MRCECLACGGKFKNSLAFADHECTTVPVVETKNSVLRKSFAELLQKDNTKKVEKQPDFA
jgi:hypothetical protein